MEPCNCCNGTPPFPADPIDCNVLVTGKTGYGVQSRNDNACPVILDQAGLTYTGSNGITKNTDGSSKKGYIILSPDSAGGLDSILGLASGKLMRIGGNAGELPDGTILLVKGNQWIAGPLSERLKLFDPTKMKTGDGKLLSLTCASGGFMELAFFPQKANTIIYMDEDGVARSYTLGEFVEELLVPFCENTPDIGDSELTGLIGCSANGLVKTSTGATRTYYHEPMVTLYSQVKYQGISASDLNPGEVTYYPPLPVAVAGLFIDQEVEIDLTEMPGYKASANSVIISTQAGVGIIGTAGIEKWHLVMTINGRERMRVTAGEGAGSWNNSQNQFSIPIPSDKKIRISAQRQVSAPGTPGEIAYAVVYLEAFLFN